MVDLTGRQIGHYQVLQRLGEGGMATVYKAYDLHLERYVAIKVILPGKHYSDNFQKRFEREAKTLAMLTHPNIVGIIDYGLHEGMPYLVMEYLPGGTLKEQMGRPIPYQKAARLLIPIAQALAFAHQHKIIHRDLKPANILLTESSAPMLSDFGIAKLLEADPQLLSLTGSGVGIGTPEYMSPEQGQGLPLDQRTDIYSLGIVFYEMVTGRKPYQADTPMAIVIKHISEPLPRPRAIIPDLPVEVENILFKAMAKNPENRYQSMIEFSTALEGLAQKAGATETAYPPVSAPPSYPSTPRIPRPTTTYPPPSLTREKKSPIMKWGITGGIVIFLGLCLAILAGSGIWWIIRRQNQTTTSKPVETAVSSPETAQHFTGTSPTIASAEETGAELDKNEQDRAVMLYALAQQQNSSDENKIFLVSLEQSQPVLWNWGWCAKTRPILDENLQHIEFAFFINGSQISQDQLVARYSSRAQYECYYLYTLLDRWPVGPHELVVRTRISQDIQDGYKDFPAQIQTNTYNVFVKN